MVTGTQGSELSFRRLIISSIAPTINEQITSTLLLVNIVAEFTGKVAHLYCSFGHQLLEILEEYREKSDQLADNNESISCSKSTQDAWYALLREMHAEAKAHSSLSNVLLKNVMGQLVDMSTHKSHQTERVINARTTMETNLDKAQEKTMVSQCRLKDLYSHYQVESKDTVVSSSKALSTLFNTHNEYVLDLHASNQMKKEYYLNCLPEMLQELEDIQLEANNVLNGAIESHCYLRLSDLNLIREHYETVLTVCKSVTPKEDIRDFVRSFHITDEVLANTIPELDDYQPGALDEEGLFVLREEIIFDKLTEMNMKSQQTSLQKEQAELSSFIKQNQEVILTLQTHCQGHSSNHLYDKVYENEEDLSRKRSEIRMASVQLAAVQAQMDLMNYNKKEDLDDGKDADGASIKGLWRRAFNSLKIKDKGGRKKKDCKDEDEVDPVYSLLKRAADKGVQKCAGCSDSVSPRRSLASSVAGSATSSPTPAGKKDSVASANYPPSFASSSGSSQATPPNASWTRRKAMMNAFRMKSISVDESGNLYDNDPHAGDRPSLLHLEKKTSDPGNTELSVTETNKSIPVSPSTRSKLFHSHSVAGTNACSSVRPQNVVNKHVQVLQKSERPANKRLNSRMKSFSVDNPDTVSDNQQTAQHLTVETKKKSTSFTNTNFIESEVPPSPRRKKQLYGRMKSFSVEQENTIRRVEFSDENISRTRLSPRGSPGRGNSVSPNRISPNSPKQRSPGGISPIRTERSPNREEMLRQVNMKRLQWRMKSFSLDNPESCKRVECAEGGTMAVAAARATSPLVVPDPLGGGASGYSRPLEPHYSPVKTYESSKPYDEHRERYGSPKSQHKSLKDQRLAGNLFVVLYDFKARHRDEMDLKAGYKLSCTEMSDPDWWRGRCMGRVGLFPATYVMRIRQGDVIWRITHPLHLRDETGQPVRLYRGQIVVQCRREIVPEPMSMVPIRIKGSAEVLCPLKYLTRVYD